MRAHSTPNRKAVQPCARPASPRLRRSGRRSRRRRPTARGTELTRCAPTTTSRCSRCRPRSGRRRSKLRRGSRLETGGSQSSRESIQTRRRKLTRFRAPTTIRFISQDERSPWHVVNLTDAPRHWALAAPAGVSLGGEHVWPTSSRG